MEFFLSNLEWRFFFFLCVIKAFAEKYIDEDLSLQFPLLFVVTCLVIFVHLQTYDGMIIGEHSRDTDLDVRILCVYLLNTCIYMRVCVFTKYKTVIMVFIWLTSIITRCR